ncbi:MAG: biotin/lipoyl-containing protein, partial [Bacteroidota bacterium]|nr:biotin/lipoyl-containing protein [Bacteroidota bacterium]
MLFEIKIPTPGESITEVEIGKWLVADGDLVSKDQEIAEVESDKATLTLAATESGQIKILISEGETVAVGTIVCNIDTSVAPEKNQEKQPIASELFPEPKEVAVVKSAKSSVPEVTVKQEQSNVKITPLAHKMMEDNHLSMEDVLNGLHRISKSDIEAVLALPK